MEKASVNLAIVDQEPLVFSQSVTSNIKFFKESTQSDVEAVAKISQIHNEIEIMPADMKKCWGKEVYLFLADKTKTDNSRALLGNPDLLLMDDVTSSLDAENEFRFWRDLGKYQGAKTIILVTNRLETVRNADLI